MKRSAMRIIIEIHKALAVISFGFAVILVVVGTVRPDGINAPLVVISALLALALYTIGLALNVLLAIEANTRDTAAYFRKRRS